MKWANFVHMKIANPILRELLAGEELVCPDFIEEQAGREDNCVYLASCVFNEYVFVGESFRRITGHSSAVLLHHGLDRWGEMVHPDDMEGVLNRMVREILVVQAAEHDPGVSPRPFSVEYRLKHASGGWIWVRDTKCVVSLREGGHIDMVLGSLEDITSIKRYEASFFAGEGEDKVYSSRVVELWKELRDLRQHDQPTITRREKEVLGLIGEGMSSKQIAYHLRISINTVESHRRHLIEKFQATNSVELIRKASGVLTA